MTSRNNVFRDMTASEDIEGFGARLSMAELRGELVCSGCVRVWYDALFFKKYVFDSPTRGA